MVRRKSFSEEVEETKNGLTNIVKNPRKSLLAAWPTKNKIFPMDGQLGENRVKTEMDGFDSTYKYFEFPDITPPKLKAMTTITVADDFQKGTFLDRIVIPHRGVARLAMNKFLFVVAFYNLFATPFYVIFGVELSGIHLAMQVFIYLSFMIDMMCNCFTTFLSAEGLVVLDHFLIMKRYLCTWFIVDLLASIPYPVYQTSENLERSFHIDWAPDAKYPCPTISVFQVIAIFLKFVREFQRIRVKGILGESDVWYTVGLFSAIVAFIHMCTVVLFMCTQLPSSEWYKNASVGDKDLNTVHLRYVVHLHGAIVFVMGKGEPTCIAERWYAMTLNVIGLFITAALVGQVTHLISKYNAKTTKWRLKINEINDSMAQMGLSRDLQVKIRNYHAFSWAVNGGEDKGQKWLGDVSREYHEQAKIQVNERLIASVPIFKEANREFVHAIIMNLKQQLYLPGDYIIKCGDIGDEMYFIVRGTVQAMDKMETTIYTVLSEGSFFGEIALLKKNSKRTATVRAFTYSQLNVLYKTDFEEILTNFPEDAILLEKEAKLRERNSDNVQKIKAKRSKKNSKRSLSQSSEHDESQVEDTNPGGTQNAPSVLEPVASSNFRKTTTVVLAKQKMKANLPVGQHNTIANLDADGEIKSFNFTRKSQKDILMTLKILQDHILKTTPGVLDLDDEDDDDDDEDAESLNDIGKRNNDTEESHESETANNDVEIGDEDSPSAEAAAGSPSGGRYDSTILIGSQKGKSLALPDQGNEK